MHFIHFRMSFMLKCTTNGLLIATFRLKFQNFPKGMNLKVNAYFLAAVVQLCLVSLAFSQTETPVVRGNDVWFLQLTRYHINDQWIVSNELHLRRHDWLKEQEQIVIRPAINFSPVKGITFTTGYSFLLTWPYGPFSTVPVNIPENNIWQEVTLQNLFWDRLNFLHRLRLEERWVGVPSQQNGEWLIDDFAYANRFRYRLITRFDILRFEKNQALYASLFDEIWIHLNNQLKPKSFDKNWMYLGFGYRFNENVQIELAYLDQWVMRQNFTENYKGLQMVLIYDFGTIGH